MDSRRSAYAQSQTQETELSYLRNLQQVSVPLEVSLPGQNLLHDCIVKCMLPPKGEEEKFFRNSLDLLCEDRCFADQLKLRKQARLAKEEDAVDARERCMADCFIARRGNADNVLCIEKCNMRYSEALGGVIKDFREAFSALGADSAAERKR